MYTNCDTLTNKISELIMAIEHNNPDIVVITEVTLDGRKCSHFLANYN